MKPLIILLLLLSLTGSVWASDWEKVDRSISRTRVPHGWLVQASNINGFSICYVPDENHEWRVE